MEANVTYATQNGAPSEACERVGRRMLLAAVKEIRRSSPIDTDDVASAALYECMQLLTGCTEDRHTLIEIYQGAAFYFTDLAKQLADA
jgi:hypothetical protein